MTLSGNSRESRNREIMMNVLAGIHRTRHNRGFTAIEVSAVATIIAILALILIPIVRNRVAEARLVAAQDDMASIEKAQSIAYGFTGKYFGLMGLERDGFVNKIAPKANAKITFDVAPAPITLSFDIFLALSNSFSSGSTNPANSAIKIANPPVLIFIFSKVATIP